jgi:Z1 domain
MPADVVGFDAQQGDSLTRPINIDGTEIHQLEKRYKGEGRISDDEWDSVVTTAAHILSECPNPDGNKERRTGLALGKVQSGKTLSYTALIALGLENGYRLPIVLAGTKRPLLEQTYSRLVYDLDARRSSLTPFKNPTYQDMEVIHSILHTGGSCLLVTLKNRSRIDNLRQLLNNVDLKSYPFLIIDDEGDEASLNTQFRQGRRSATYNSILNLRGELPLHAYIAYTATPQANLLISGLDALSPDFAELVEPGSGYCGGRSFFGENRDLFLRTVHLDQNNPAAPYQITEDVQFAIACFIMGGVIRQLRGDDSVHSMLLHTSNLRSDHEQLHQAIQLLMSNWKDIAGLPSSDPSSERLINLMKRAYEDLNRTVKAPPSWEMVQERIKDELWLTEIWMVNSLPYGRDPVATPFRLKNNILVGGNMLGRGVTLEGLAVTYITREAEQDTNADTLEQRARWFGYKEAYLDVCRIFLTQRLASRYTELLQHEDDFWEALRRNQRQGINVKDWPRMFRLDAETWQLRPTRPQVADYRQFRSTGWDVQRRPILDPILCTVNLEGVKEFMDKYPGQLYRVGNVEHTLVRDLDPAAVISDLLSVMNLDGSDWDKSYTVEYLTRLQIGNRLARMDIAYMSKGEFRERSISPDGHINPMQGRSPSRSPDDPDYYPGDESIHNNRVQLQIHLIKIREKPEQPTIETTALALYIPVLPEFDLRMIVRSTND